MAGGPGLNQAPVRGSLCGVEMRGTTRHRYDAFALEAADSPCFASWARGVAGDPEVLAWLDTLPELKRQPNLVFAAARWHGAVAPAPYEELRRVLLERSAEVGATVLTRSTQTNEVGRLATLVPVLAQLADRDGPLSLVEVGASAGLCLYPDRYDYEWPLVGALRGSGGPVLTARVAGALPVPGHHPEIVWRGGCDLNPLDVRDADARAWLEGLVWPEQEGRRERLRAALEVARAEPPTVVAGDLLDRLLGLIAEASRHGCPVVMHSAVIAYLDDAGRQRFHELMTSLVAAGDCRWVSNEAAQVLPEAAASAPAQDPGRPGFVLAVDGRAVARTHGHGEWIDWFGAG